MVRIKKTPKLKRRTPTTPSTKDIVVQFVKTHLERKGHKGLLDGCKYGDQTEPEDVPSDGERNSHEVKINHNDKPISDETREICLILTRISTKLEQFIEANDLAENFTIYSDSLLDNLHYRTFEVEADELFSEGIVWNHIVTFLLHVAETACRIIETKEHEETSGMLKDLIMFTCMYFDQNLLKWIKEQQAGWMDIKNYEKEIFEPEESTDQPSRSQHESPRSTWKLFPSSSGMKLYLGVAAIFALIAYAVCARFHLHN